MAFIKVERFPKYLSRERGVIHQKSSDKHQAWRDKAYDVNVIGGQVRCYMV